MTAQLIVSLSGINASTLDLGGGLATELALRRMPLSLLFAPRVAGVDQPEAVLAWVREQQVAGHALLQHGYDQGVGGRAEFRSLPGHEARLRLTAAASAMERFGLATDAFVPPRWLVSSSALGALRHHGFRVCADLLGVRDLRTSVVHRGRVWGFGFGAGAVRWRTEPWWCYALVMGAARAARRGRLIRLAVDTADLARSGPRRALLDAVDIALHHGASPVTYPGLVRALKVAS